MLRFLEGIVSVDKFALCVYFCDFGSYFYFLMACFCDGLNRHIGIILLFGCA